MFSKRHFNDNSSAPSLSFGQKETSASCSSHNKQKCSYAGLLQETPTLIAATSSKYTYNPKVMVKTVVNQVLDKNWKALFDVVSHILITKCIDFFDYLCGFQRVISIFFLKNVFATIISWAQNLLTVKTRSWTRNWKGSFFSADPTSKVFLKTTGMSSQIR